MLLTLVCQVRERCRREWTMFQERMATAEKAYFESMGIDPPNSTARQVRGLDHNHAKEDIYIYIYNMQSCYLLPPLYLKTCLHWEMFCSNSTLLWILLFPLRKSSVLFIGLFFSLDELHSSGLTSQLQKVVEKFQFIYVFSM